jgi:oligopeptide/dipeptide ABC transporter ATP-binding protein
LADRVAVMYLGKIVEEGPAAAVLETPAHPYTRSLVDSIPTPDKPGRRARQAPPGGDPPSPLAPPVGCGYHPRCPRATALCRTQPPMLAARTSSHKAACIHPLDETEG